MSTILVNALTSLAQVKSFIPASVSPSKEDNELIDIINAVSLEFEEYMGRNIKQRFYRPSGADTGIGEENIKLNGNHRIGATTFLLPHFPIAGITAVQLNDKALDAVKTLDVATDLVFDPETGQVELIDGDVWPMGIQNIEVTWSGGFSPVPNDLEVKCVEQVINNYYVFERSRMGLTTTNVQGEVVTFENSEFLAGVRGVLNRYRLKKF